MRLQGIRGTLTSRLSAREQIIEGKSARRARGAYLAESFEPAQTLRRRAECWSGPVHACRLETEGGLEKLIDGLVPVAAQLVTLDTLPEQDGPGVLSNQLVAAVQQSAHKDVASAREAVEVVDGQEVLVRQMTDPRTGRRFTLVEYWVGGNPYGALFWGGQPRPIAAIRDGTVGR